MGIQGVARIRGVGCTQPGLAPYPAHIRCPKLRCVLLIEQIKIIMMAFLVARIGAQKDPCVHPFLLKHLFLEGVDQPKISPQTLRNALSDALLMSRFENLVEPLRTHLIYE